MSKKFEKMEFLQMAVCESAFRKQVEDFCRKTSANERDSGVIFGQFEVKWNRLQMP